jgi:hypothetical protein
MGQHGAARAHGGQLRLGIGQLGIGAAQIDTVGNAAGETVARDARAAAIGGHRVGQNGISASAPRSAIQVEARSASSERRTAAASSALASALARADFTVSPTRRHRSTS